ncbi:MAG: tetratricopeptide repeat protein [Chthoniobacter sp.]|uniref:tetratricopeptide repeat protein n=1 Tax=Chthoniobacter sp. TaxID=2510640 RepID=UPI0032A2A5EA
MFEPPPNSNPRRVSIGLWLFFLAFGVRLLVLVRFSHSLSFLPEGDDMKFYSDWAMRIAHGQWTDHQAFYGLPGYAYCLALIFLLVGGFDPFVVGILQALLDAGIAVVLWQISREVFAVSDRSENHYASPRRADFIGIGAALAWTFFTPAQAFSAVLMPTVWLVFAYYFCLWFAVKTRASSWWKPWLGLGLFVGFVAMLVATILFAVPLLIAAIFRSVAQGQPWRVRMPKMAAAMAVFVAGVYVGASPAWIHNYYIAHEPVMLSAHSGINFWIGNNPTATGYPKMPPGIRATQEGLLKDSITLAESAAGRKLTRAEVSKYWSAQANAYISTHFSAWMRLIVVKFGNFWNAYQYDDLSIIKLLRDDGVLPPGLKFGFIAALGLAGLLPTLRRFPRSAWVVAAVFLHMCALLPVFVTERYRLAAVPGLMILGAAGLWIFWQNLIAARWARAGLYVVLCAGAAWFVSIPRSDIGLWSLDHYKAGIRATTAGELELERQNPAAAAGAFDRAQQNLETAYRYVPKNADIDFALGNLWLARGNQPTTDEPTKTADRSLARKWYGSALKLNPHHVGTLNNCGVLEMDEKHWPLAERFFSAAIDAEPTDAKAYYLLAHVRDEMGKPAEAKAAIEEALRLRPNQRQFLELRDKIAAPPPKASPPL